MQDTTPPTYVEIMYPFLCENTHVLIERISMHHLLIQSQATSNGTHHT